MTANRRILAIIPARKGSKRLPRKNVAPLGGKPLIAWSIDTALDCDLFVDVVVSTDDDEAADIAKAHGANVPWLRPAELATDTASTASVLQHTLNWFENHHGKVDSVVLLQPTSPFRTIKSIQGAVSKYLAQDQNNPQSIVTVSDVAQHPAWCFSISGDRMDPILGWDKFKYRSQDLQPVYALNGCIYVFPSALVRAGGPLLLPGCKPFIIHDQEEVLDIDTEIQLNLAEAIAQKRLTRAL